MRLVFGLPTKKVRNWLFGSLICLLMNGCAGLPVENDIATTTHREILLKDLSERHGVLLQWDSISQVFTLIFNDVKAKGLVDSDVVLIEGDKVTLSAPVRAQKSTIVVPIDFESRIIKRMQERARGRPEYLLTKLRQVIIDAGHGGKDPGAIGRTGIYEKGVVLDIALQLKGILEKNGIQVLMTRTDDTFISLQERTEIASRSKADLFVSIHANANHVRSIHGLEVYALGDLNSWEFNEDQRLKNYELLFGNLSMSEEVLDLKSIVADMLYAHKQSQSSAFAADVAKKTSRFVNTKNLGRKEARFFVLRNTLIPAVLVEVGFLSNPKEERLLKTSAYRKKLADGLADCILDYVSTR